MGFTSRTKYPHRSFKTGSNVNPEDGADLLRTNDNYVFFREVNEVPADKGPLGAMNRSITTDRSVAVDPAFVTLGGPVWLEKDGRTPIRRLMIAQDTGSAIKGAQRADIFFGTGDEAGRLAGQIKDGGRLVQLVPIHAHMQWPLGTMNETPPRTAVGRT